MATAADLSPRLGEVLAGIRRLIAAEQHPPTTREIAAELGVSTAMAHRYLTRLRSLGMVQWDEGRARTLRIVDDDRREQRGA